jgi:hypothetical protein
MQTRLTLRSYPAHTAPELLTLPRAYLVTTLLSLGIAIIALAELAAA